MTHFEYGGSSTAVFALPRGRNQTYFRGGIKTAKIKLNLRGGKEEEKHNTKQT